MTSIVPTNGGHFNFSNTFTNDWTFRNQFVYDNSFLNDLHQVTGLVGVELRNNKSTRYSDFLRGYNLQTMKYQTYDIYALKDNVDNPVLG